MVRHLGKHGFLAALAAVGLVGATAVSASAAASPAPVKAQPNPIREYGAAVSSSYFAWSQTSKLKPHTYNVYEQAMSGGLPSGPVTRVNVFGTRGFTGGISGTRLAYQQIVNGQSDIRFYNLALRQHSNPPPGVNSSQWEFGPSISGDWLLFGREGGGKSRVLLENLLTHSVRVLFVEPINSSFTTFADPGQVNGDFASFDISTGLGTNDVYLYTISTRTLTKIQHPAGTEDLATAVSTTGTLYFDRLGRTCSSTNRLMELPLGGTPTTLWTINPGGSLEHIQTYNDGTNDQLFYTRLACSTGGEDIYTITGA